MPGLILKLRAHEQILVNGVVMQNGDRNARLIVKTADAHILRLRDAIHPDDVDTPVKRVCYIAQLAVAGEVEPEQAVTQLGSGIAQLQDALAGFDGSQRVNDFFEFNFDSMQWTPVLALAGTPPSPRHSHASVVHGNSMFVFGGYDGSYRSDFHE